MIQTEFYMTRKDGVKLYRTFSDADMMIRQNETQRLYGEAIDVENSGYTYTETDIPVDTEPVELTVEDTLGMLSELGVDTDDQ